jgi:hypothetical protein
MSHPCQIKGATAEERVAAWYNHFKSLLENPPVIENEDDEVIPIYWDLPIQQGLFTMKEYQKAKCSLKRVIRTVEMMA